MNTLILYASNYGQTAKIAEFIAGTINDKQVNSAKCFNVKSNILPSQADLAAASNIVLCGSLHVGSLQKKLAVFVKSNAEILNKKDTHLVTVSMAINSKNEKDKNEVKIAASNFAKKNELIPKSYQFFEGAIPYTKYNFLVKFVMKKIAAKEGFTGNTDCDHEFTNWDDVKSFSLSLCNNN